MGEAASRNRGAAWFFRRVPTVRRDALGPNPLFDCSGAIRIVFMTLLGLLPGECSQGTRRTMSGRINTFDDWKDLFRNWWQGLGLDRSIAGEYKFDALYSEMHSGEVEFGD